MVDIITFMLGVLRLVQFWRQNLELLVHDPVQRLPGQHVAPSGVHLNKYALLDFDQGTDKTPDVAIHPALCEHAFNGEKQCLNGEHSGPWHFFSQTYLIRRYGHYFNGTYFRQYTKTGHL